MPTLHAEVSNSNHRFVFKTYSKIFLLVCVPYFMQIKTKYSCKRILEFHAFSKPLILIKLIFFWVKTSTKSTTVPNNIKQRACKMCRNVLYRWQIFNLNWLEKQPIYLYLHYSKSTCTEVNLKYSWCDKNQQIYSQYFTVNASTFETHEMIGSQ